MEKTTRCTQCAAEFTDAELSGVSCCPSCGSKGVPCSIAEDVTVKMNWHELRILGIFADNWARSHCDAGAQKTVSAILSRLQDQFPDKTALSLGGEVRQLQKAGFDAELRSGSGEIIVPRPVKN